MNGFEERNIIGRNGEIDFIRYCQQRSLIVTDVTQDKKYQKIDVDFIVNGYYVELKTDNLIHKTGNFPVELIHHRKTGDKQGWYYYTEAKYIIRYSKAEKKLYVLYFDKCKDYILTHFDKRKWFDKDDNDYVTGLLMNVKVLQRLGFLRIIDM